ncbi:hypothetical protein RN607_03310 [Demequina capsici]|uniref:Uncharacterized protein n=1 Tax=Demequina capsici TaxID=3075620 RepID=A0AA96FDN2_9MICO|nr:hypothetical protein [Demequina sp. PMTSA13]WNM28043.1 hypothetical protein RN607_03310 [Demequina sp. PMTSA13]
MGWTLTSVVARTLRPFGWGRRWLAQPAVEHAQHLAEAGARERDAAARAWERRLEGSSLADRRALETAHAELDADSDVIRRAGAAGAPVDSIAALASGWRRLNDDAKAAARDPFAATVGVRREGPVAFGVVTARQVDQTTCGAAVLGLMHAATDPFVAIWVVTGRLFAGYTPEAVAAAIIAGGAAADGIEGRWTAVQRGQHAATTRRALGPFGWPRSLGTPPWRLADLTRPYGVRYRSAVLDDRSQGAVQAMVAHASAALADGLLVPLYSAGDSDLGIDTVVPRHVVLLVAATDDGFLAYEPGRGALVALGAEAFRGPGPRRAGLGNWSRVAWVVLPSPADGH